MAVADSSKPLLPEVAPLSPFYTEEHEAFRRTVRRFVDREIMSSKRVMPPTASFVCRVLKTR